MTLMRHPIHDILIRWLDTEQYAFDEGSQEFWPPGSRSQGGEDNGGDFGENSRPSEDSTRNPE